MGIRHFRHMLEGRPFTVYTDHKPLTHAIARVSEPWTARQCRHLAYIAEYTSDIQHVAGISNVVADTLSCPPGHVPRAHSSPSFPASAGKCWKRPAGYIYTQQTGTAVTGLFWGFWR
jgi:hypothetical protein